MSPSNGHLTLRPDRCNECGACVEVCPNSAIKVGQGYILVDWNACNQCCGCVEVCKPRAIQRLSLSARSAATSGATGEPGGKVVVGSRAEAKQVRKAAEQAAKQAGKATKSPRATRLSVVPAVGAAASAAAAAADNLPIGRPGELDSDGVAAAKPRAAAAPKPKARSAAVAGADELVLGDVRWTLVDTFAVLALLLATLVGKNAVAAMPVLALMPASGRAGARAIILAVYYGVQLSGLAFLAQRHGSGLLRSLGLTGSANEEGGAPARGSVLSSAGLVLGLLVVTEFVAISYGLTAQSLGWSQPLTLSTDVSAVFGGGGVGLALAVVLVALVAPFVEELAFRGVVLSGLGGRLGMWPSIVISAAIFAAYHASLWMLFPMFVLGAAAAWLTWRQRSLWPAIALHVLYNGLAVGFAFFLPR